MATAEQILQCRYELADTEVALPILVDAEYGYFIDKHNGSISRASLDAAKTIMFKLSMRSDDIVDVLSVKHSKAAQNYIEALKLYIKDQSLNPIIRGITGYASNISKKDMQANDANTDNSTTPNPAKSIPYQLSQPYDPFLYNSFYTITQTIS